MPLKQPPAATRQDILQRLDLMGFTPTGDPLNQFELVFGAADDPGRYVMSASLVGDDDWPAVYVYGVTAMGHMHNHNMLAASDMFTWLDHMFAVEQRGFERSLHTRRTDEVSA